MISYLFQCPACKQTGASAETFPLCRECDQSLVPCPRLCPSCGGHTCEDPSSSVCSRPWLQQTELDSFTARYLLIEPGYRVLRRWKMSRGPVLDHRILNLDGGTRERVQKIRPDVIVPMPQRFNRSWRLGGSPAEKLAYWISEETRTPIAHLLNTTSLEKPTLQQLRGLSPFKQSALSPHQRAEHSPRQAELRMQDRIGNRLLFAYNEDIPVKREATVLLVDDFMTTGHTLKAAAKILRSRGVLRVHAFCLGARPLRVSTGHRLGGDRQLERCSDLGERA